MDRLYSGIPPSQTPATTNTLPRQGAFIVAGGAQPRRAEPSLTTPTKESCASRLSPIAGLPLNPPSSTPSSTSLPWRPHLAGLSPSEITTRRSDTLVATKVMGNGSNLPNVSNSCRPCPEKPTMLTASPTCARRIGSTSRGKYCLVVRPSCRSKCGNAIVARSRSRDSAITSRS